MPDILPRAATFSKGAEFWGGDDWHPKTILAGLGARVLGDDDEPWYLDWVSGLGATLLGHGHKGWMERLHGPLHGCAFSLPHYLEQQVAEKLVHVLGTHVPGWQPDGLSVRFGLSGSDACAMAVRLARAVTGRQGIVSIGYHGWASEFVAATPPAWGVPAQPVYALPFGVPFYDLPSYDIAAVIVEQPPQEAPAGYWEDMREWCDDVGALLILDEVVTGFRFGLGGAAERFGIHPDIAVYGKGLGNGVPISAMVFPREMASWFSRSDPVFVSSTHFGCTIGLASADYILDNWTADDVTHLWAIGQLLMTGLRGLGIDTVGYPPVSLCKFPTPSERAYFIAGMRDRGVLFNRPNIPCRAHTMEDVDMTLAAAKAVMLDMASVDVEAVMAGKLPQVLFASR